MVQKDWVAVGLLALAACLGGGRIAPGEEPADPVVEALGARVSRFLEGVSRATTQAAYQELLAGSPLLKQTKAIETLVTKTDELKDRYGLYRGLERISARHVGNDLVLMRYLYKCENSPVVFYFTFYRAPRPETPAEKNDNWRVIIVRFDTELELLGLTASLK